MDRPAAPHEEGQAVGTGTQPTISSGSAAFSTGATTRFATPKPERCSSGSPSFDWEPLLYLAYSRIDSDDPGHDPLASPGSSSTPVPTRRPTTETSPSS